MADLLPWALIGLIDNKQVELDALRERVISCRNCPRLVNYVSKVSREKVRRYMDWRYWDRPLLGFGDPEARLLVIGLAPAAHGGNRTGRMFTGDSSGDWLIRAMYETGFSNQPESVSSEDGLELDSAYITAVVRCAPPKNRPLSEEIRNCSKYLKEEANLLDRVEAVLTLGRMAFDTYNKYMFTKDGGPRPSFRHGGFYDVRGTPSLVTSYHPSRQNTQTGRLTWEMWIGVFNRIRNMLR